MNTENFKKLVMYEMLMRRAFGPPFNEPQQLYTLNAYRQFLSSNNSALTKLDLYERHTERVVSFLRLAIEQFMEWPITSVEKEALMELLTAIDNISCEGEVFCIVDETLVLTERLKRVSTVLKAA